jgi:uncharacterized protein YunC (DUF1805 family)
MDKVTIDDMEFRADCVPVCGANLLVIQGQRGMLGCGYFNLATADKLVHALAIVSGVSCYDDMLEKSVVAVSKSAEAMGVAIGMSGKDALVKMSL